MYTRNLDKALRFAATAHSGQVRKGTEVPYIVHPVAVFSILQQQNCPEPVVIAGLLHDTVEDTDIQISDIDAEFGSKVADIVNACTEPDKTLPWERRKAFMIERAKTADIFVKWVLCADKYHNLLSMSHDFQTMGDQLWTRFSRGYEPQKWYMQSMVEALLHNLNEKNRKPMFEKFKELVCQFFTQTSRVK